MVYRSSNPWVGCAWRPSPALITCSCGLTWRAIRYGAPAEPWRTTNTSACIAERLATVSSSDSPLDCELTATFRLMTSADSRLAAISKVVRVRVEASKNRLNTLLPRISGTFFTSRSVTPAKGSAVSRICVRISRGSPSIDSRCCSSPLALSCGLGGIFQIQGQLAVVGALQAQAFAFRHLHHRADVLSGDGQLPSTAVREHHQRNAPRPAVVEQFIHRRAHGAPGIEHVVHQQEVAAFDLERDFRALGIVLEALFGVVVAVEGDVHEPQRILQAKQRMQPLGEPGAARIQADHRGGGRDARFQFGRKFRQQDLGFRELVHAGRSPKYCSRMTCAACESSVLPRARLAALCLP